MTDKLTQRLKSAPHATDCPSSSDSRRVCMCWKRGLKDLLLEHDENVTDVRRKSHYVPNTETVREAYAEYMKGRYSYTQSREAFDVWLDMMTDADYDTYEYQE